ncbi:mannosyl-3-phosphoglycerate phosphatase-related protein YedP [Prochlorococcus marinus]|uniref:mannosyl-3-phosphoglycerate phosphatase-related protein YedP n=1 Tax=Prochlorococcus marinus TaxID=1219 RepID=UPI0022B3B6A5|nr:mannosyl-3-phosphoglycerate phosphatase-related protein YedP [Prochlorococcus marinus]
MTLNTKRDKWWIVTDIDGTLMDHDYDLTPAIPTIRWLQELKIPIIPCTSKTASEVRLLRKDIDLHDPFIVENGGAVYGNSELDTKEWELILGRSYKDLKAILENISLEIGVKLKGLNDLSYEDIELLTGLKGNSIKLALAREWSVPFLNPTDEDRLNVNSIAGKYGCKIYQGNRMSHLLDENSDKGKAVVKLKKYLNQTDAKIIALGDSPNDLPLLEIADKAVVVPGVSGPNKTLVDNIKNQDLIIAPAPHSEGWAMSIKNLINSHI